MARPAPPLSRADCALGNYRFYGGPVCYGDGARHNARCPEARRLERQRAIWDAVTTLLACLAVLSLGLAAMATVWAQTCGLGARC